MKRKYKFVFMGALRNSIILSCLCNDISSTEAPGETVTTPKLRSHRWYANMSISQLSISYLQEASAATQETEESPRRRRIVVWGKLVVEVMAPSHLSASPRGCHLQRGGPWTTDRQEALWRVPIQGFIGVTHSQKSSQHVISCKDVQETIGRVGEPLSGVDIQQWRQRNRRFPYWLYHHLIWVQYHLHSLRVYPCVSSQIREPGEKTKRNSSLVREEDH